MRTRRSKARTVTPFANPKRQFRARREEYFPSSIATPIIKLCSFFKQICSRTLMEDDMVKAQSKVIDILCNLELIYPPAFFDIMIHLVIHLPLKALEGGPIPPDKDPGVSERSELFALACGPTPSPISVNSCVVNGVRFVVHNRDECRTTKNNDICSPGEKDGEMYYGQLEEILEFSYMSFKVVLFQARGESFKDDQYILVTQVKQVFFLEDMARRPPDWKVVQDVNHKKFSNRGIIMVEDDYDVIHFDNSPNLTLSTSLVDLEFATLNIDGQSMDVDAPPDIIDVDEDDDLIDDEDALPHDLAYFDDEDLTNDDVTMSADVARGHGGDGGGDDRRPPHQSQFDLTAYMQSPIWPKIYKDIEQQLTKMYTDNKSTLKHEHWIAFWLDPKNLARATQNARNQAKSMLLTQLRLQHEVGSGNRSGGGGDDESGDEEYADEDEDDEDS
ncbi:RNA-directed DNA polymerase, eukaryota [Tanacetum coccineum]|uniref:RNA-directed DNA polymerase, eukaryota n=1 Tax=Tanacetum coccineum TaxID=301880 RepID=A0ABQ5CM59_9ASTR